MTTEPTTRTSTGLELGPPIPAEEWPAIRSEAEQYRTDFRLLASRHDELVARFNRQFVAMYHGRFFHAGNPDDLFERLRDAGVDPGVAVCKYLSDEGWILTCRPW
jgi:hypothetical protein